MKTTYKLMNLAEALRAISRPVVLWHEVVSDGVSSPARWNPGDGEPLSLVHAGDTEGAFTTNFETERSNLVTPELTGSLPHRSYVSGEVPAIEGSVWLADPEIRRKWTPTNLQHGGFRRRVRAQERTLVIIPEELFLDPSDGVTEKLFGWDGQDWVQGDEEVDGLIVDGVPIPEDLEHLVGLMAWIWSVSVNRPNLTLQHDEGSRNLEAVSILPHFHPGMPNGHHAFTLGDPNDFGIDILGGS